MTGTSQLAAINAREYLVPSLCCVSVSPASALYLLGYHLGDYHLGDYVAYVKLRTRSLAQATMCRVLTHCQTAIHIIMSTMSGRSPLVALRSRHHYLMSGCTALDTRILVALVEP